MVIAGVLKGVVADDANVSSWLLTAGRDVGSGSGGTVDTIGDGAGRAAVLGAGAGSGADTVIDGVADVTSGAT